jgi:hypothetical protein
VIAAAILLASEAAQAPPSLAAVSSIVMPSGARVVEVSTADLDGDGVEDLLVASSNGTTRTLAVHLRRSSGAAFSSVPDAALDFTPDVVCFAAADVHADLGREVVLFNAGGAFAWRWRAVEESQRIQRLCSCELLWQWPDRRSVFAWQAAVLDVDGDGLEDLAIPEPDRFRVVFQKKGEAGIRKFENQTLLVPSGGRPSGRALDFERSAEVRQPGGERRRSISVTGGGLQVDSDSDGSGPYLWIKESVPTAQFADFDGDGDLDALFLENDALVVFAQTSPGVFASEPLRLKNPVPVDRARELDVSYLARNLDLDGDKRTDCVFSAGDKRSKDVRTQVLVFLAKAVKPGEPQLFGRDGVPSQVLVLDGFARPLEFADVDGDGRTDFVAGSVRPDLIDGLRAAASERIDAELYVYRNTGAGFSKRPDVTYKVSIQAGGRDLVARFLGDVTGDGVAEFFERAEKSALRVHLVRRTKEGLSIVEKPLYEMPLDPDARLLLPEHLKPGSWDVFAIEKEAVRCASFR